MCKYYLIDRVRVWNYFVFLTVLCTTFMKAARSEDLLDHRKSTFYKFLDFWVLATTLWFIADELSELKRYCLNNGGPVRGVYVIPYPNNFQGSYSLSQKVPKLLSLLFWFSLFPKLSCFALSPWLFKNLSLSFKTANRAWQWYKNQSAEITSK